MKHCKACARMVYPRKKFSFILWLFLAVTTCGIGSVAYMILYLVMRGTRCPICKGPV